MALDPSFAEAFIHRLPAHFNDGDPWSNHRVVGRRLRPLSLWHLLLLRQIDSPLLSAPLEMGCDDLLRAVSICRSRFLQTNVQVRWSPFTGWKLRGAGLLREREKLLAYVEDFLQRPEFSLAAVSHAGKSIRLGAPPDLIAVASAVIFATGWSERVVWEMPAGAVFWYEALARRQREPIDFMTADERAFQDEMEAAGFKPWEPNCAPEDDDA